MREVSIAFLYPSHYPVTGGSSVHGYYLAKGLHNEGYLLNTFTGQPDGFTKHRNPAFLSRFYCALRSDIVYLRVSLEGKSSAIVRILKLLGKKVIVELNGPSDELKVTKQYSDSQIAQVDSVLKKRLIHADAIITISEEMKVWCKKIIGHEHVFAIENGGERYISKEITPTQELEKLTLELKNNFEQLILWSGNAWPWQGVDIIIDLIKRAPKSMAFVLVCDEQTLFDEINHFPNVTVLPPLELNDMHYLITSVDAGLAHYGDYSWFRTSKFYGSSLKLYQYLANRLWVAGNYRLSDAPNYHFSEDLEETINWLKSKTAEKVPSEWPFRSWNDVAKETSQVIKKLLL